MAGVHVPSAPGFSGWTRLRDRSWKTMNPKEIRECQRALLADIDACECSKNPTIVQHATTYITADAAHAYRCQSGSRWFNPETRQMEGRSHCTCDRCF